MYKDISLQGVLFLCVVYYSRKQCFSCLLRSLGKLMTKRKPAPGLISRWLRVSISERTARGWGTAPLLVRQPHQRLLLFTKA